MQDLGNFEAALKCVPNVSDFESFADYERWKAVVKSCKEFYKIDDKLMLLAIDIKIDGEIVKKRFNRDIKTDEEFWKWGDRAYEEHFDNIRNEILFVLSHPPDYITTMVDYVYHFDNCMAKMPGLFEKECEKFAMFTMPLSPHIVRGIFAKYPDTFEEAKKRAISASRGLGGSLFREGITRTPSLIHPSQYSDSSPPTYPQPTPHNSNQNPENNSTVHRRQSGQNDNHRLSRQNIDSQFTGPRRHPKQRNNKRRNGKSQRKYERHPN